MARRASKMPWNAKPFFGGGRSAGWHVPVAEVSETPDRALMLNNKTLQLNNKYLTLGD